MRKKSNEITAIHVLLDSIDVTNSVVTIDAIATQTKIVAKIIEQKADYIIGLKGNQKNLEKHVRKLFDEADLSSRKVSKPIEEEMAHGRETKRAYHQILLPKDDAMREKWTGLHAVIMTIRTHQKKDGTNVTEKQYCISSLGKNARKSSPYVRGHWGIEL